MIVKTLALALRMIGALVLVALSIVCLLFGSKGGARGLVNIAKDVLIAGRRRVQENAPKARAAIGSVINDARERAPHVAADLESRVYARWGSQNEEVA